MQRDRWDKAGMARIAVVGSYGAGLRIHVPRMPNPGETVIGGPFQVDAGGKGSNQAIAAARLGAEVAFFTALGSDSFAPQARTLWQSEGVDASRVVAVDGSTMVGVILVDGTGQNRIAIVPGALDRITPALIRTFRDLIAAATVCLVQLEIPVPAAVEALRIAREAGVMTVFNPAPARPLDRSVLALVDVLTPNESEAAALVGRKLSVEELGRTLLAWGVRYTALTLGERGALLVSREATVHVPAYPVHSTIDTTGAGDAFNAALAVALAEGATALDAVRWGCAAGALEVQGPGVVPPLPRREQVLETLERRAPIELRVE